MWDRRAHEKTGQRDSERAVAARRERETADCGSDEVARLQRCGSDTGDTEAQLGRQCETASASGESAPPGGEAQSAEDDLAEPERRPKHTEHGNRYRSRERQRDEQAPVVGVHPPTEEEIARNVDENTEAEREAVPAIERPYDSTRSAPT